MNWKIATLGLGSVMVLLAAFSLSNTVMGFVGGTIHVYVPKAELQGVDMYGGSHENASVVVQHLNSLNCPQGQVITRKMTLSGMTSSVTVMLSMDNANLSNVLMKAENLKSSSGTLDNVVMTVENELGPYGGLRQQITRGTMYNLDTDIYFVSMGSLVYENLKIKILYQ
jgi:hypothetical protein